MNNKSIKDDFGTSNTYKLFRTVYEIIHPTISKKNISNYKIIVRDDLFPLRIFYPKKISKIEKVMIYLHGNRKITGGIKDYNDVCQELVNNTEILLIAIDYEMKSYEETAQICLNTINYLIDELHKIKIAETNITVIGDSTGASLLASGLISNENKIKKQILIYPALNLVFKEECYKSLNQNSQINIETLKYLTEYSNKYINKQEYKSPLTNLDYKNWPTTLIITGDLDPLRDEGIDLSKKLKEASKKVKEINIKFASHGFLNGKDEESIEECMKEINKFILKNVSRSE